jgi:Trp operon repressor
MIELYNIYYENAKKDTNAFKAFVDFSEKFFATEKESELLALLQKADVGDEDN